MKRKKDKSLSQFLEKSGADCHQCSVSLTYHLNSNDLICHYCGFKQKAPKVCPACGSPNLKPVGIGTEKIEDDLKSFFPHANIQRMDYDTTRKKHAYSKIINEFESGQIDILVGTQMLSKGLDFDNVTLVGIFDADRMLHFPDFRANERAFQMITQVSGRAGRKANNGKVVIQTSNPNNPVLEKVINNDYLGFYLNEIQEREEFNYPPYSRIIKITVKHLNQNIAFTAAELLAKKMQKFITAKRVLGPEKAIVERIRNQYLYDIYLKLEKSVFNIMAIKTQLSEEISNLLSEKDFKSVRFNINVDPQ